MDIARKAENLFAVRVVRAGLVSMIPVLMIGAFALVLKSFPVAAYQEFVAGFGDGFLLRLFDLVYSATFGVLSVYMTFFISRAFMRAKADPDVPMGGALASSLVAFFMLAGVDSPAFALDYLGPKSMFMAILTGLGATALYYALCKAWGSRSRAVLARGADEALNRAMRALLPIVATVVAFALLDATCTRLFDAESIREIIVSAFSALFEGSDGQSFASGLLFVLLSSVLWFFGIHGSDTLEGAMQEHFVPNLAANQSALAAGAEPANILTKQFFDCFVLIGGCGTAICLLIAILLFSRNRGRRKLGAAAAGPMLFNINELMVFGLPIIYNPVMLVPFLLTPLVCFTTAYLATSMGWVPVTVGEVEWTTPVLIGGYYATDSVAGSVLQLVNMAIGTAIYAPFVKMLDRQSDEEARKAFDDFMEFFRKNEADLDAKALLERLDVYGEIAKSLAAEIEHDMPGGTILHYQPQYDERDRVVGVEALLRWEHPEFGMLYPPLVIKLAEGAGCLADLEEGVTSRVLEEADAVRAVFGDDVKISFNITGSTVVTERFLEFCRREDEKRPFAGAGFCIEVTEQAAVSFDEATLATLGQLREMGIALAIDDFSMGHTSVNYLKNDLFDFIKLDGSLVSEMLSNANCREIIASIANLADSLNMTVIAECVETEAQRDALREMGCGIYQGYLYSTAVPIGENPR